MALSRRKSTTRRRRGTPTSATGAELVLAAEQLLREEGYAAVTSRTLAERLNLSRQIVHYYFKSIDDVLIAVIRNRAAKHLTRLEAAAVSDEPLRKVWEICNDPGEAALALELYALANRRPAVRAEVKRYAEQFRAFQTQALIDHLKARGIEPAMNPLVATVLLTSLPQTLALEAAIDIDLGHKETLDFVDLCLRAFAERRDAPTVTTPAKKPKPPKPGAAEGR